VDHVRKELLMYNHLDLHSKKNLKKRWWTADEDNKLNDLVKKFGVSLSLTAGQKLEENSLLLQGAFRRPVPPPLAESPQPHPHQRPLDQRRR
jgi:hypothetical protein